MRFLKWRRLTNRLHLILGLIASTPLILLGLTGAILVFEPELERGLAPQLWRVEPASARRSYQELLNSIKSAYPNYKIVSLLLPLRPEIACVFYAKQTASDPPLPLAIHVDPFTGQILGSRTALESPIGFIRILHTNFLLTWGGYIGGTASAILLVLLGSGLVLWWPTGKDKTAGLRVRLGRHWRTTNYDVHRAFGFYVAPVLFLIALTGCVFTFHTVLHPLIHALTFTTPYPRTATAKPLPGVVAMNLDELITRSGEVMPGTLPTVIAFPSKPGDPIRINRRRPTGEPRDTGRSSVLLHPQTGEFLLEHSYRTRTFGDDVISWNRHMHVGAWGLYFGQIPGLLTKVVWLIVSLSPPALAVSGLLIWWKPKLRKKGGTQPGHPQETIQQNATLTTAFPQQTILRYERQQDREP
ncbi:PepSY-associated TM helix domain-containing protein [Singulisphaera acidiphila]|uniref:Putative iron-regulated membrane protein n=1 Tax=Singulisphaera acidiphila (strain ATCC BAA-1392 / DSM 18658 / VKM B-2454 / MOB10) TaxID=886293 RepID=L0DF18_SINAD|nr:PepSY-associated TM helix domain-containing protein [Singulisphaera acidiphila]AGA27398.1 putative iron-regulated membrane protein [Singulisphaera acidiphila DSM 18658]